MAGYVVTVDFTIVPAGFDEFLRLVRENAAASLRDEGGCQRFDVCTPRDGASHVFLYEVYEDEAAFKAHLASSHFKAFAAATEGLIQARNIVPFDLQDDPTEAVLGALPG